MEFKYAIMNGWSDLKCYEIIRKVSDKCLEIRYMKQTFVNRKEVNADSSTVQEWTFESCPMQEIERIRLSKNKGWYGKAGRFQLSETPKAYYDVNF